VRCPKHCLNNLKRNIPVLKPSQISSNNNNDDNDDDNNNNS